MPGTWNMVNKVFKTPVAINSWIIVDFTCSNSTNQFLNQLSLTMKNVGMGNFSKSIVYSKIL
ncbi:hypothetical protein B0H19DRAFT_1163985 [Mycena capillaripes]|nr:hypothetical protein B0H19DRAFT_1163985 [Mycena capillaripes]